MRHHLLLGLCLGIFIQANLANGSIFGLFGNKDVSLDPSCNCSRIKIDGSLQLNQFLQGFLVKLAQTYNQLVHGIPPQIGSGQTEVNAPRYGYEIIFRILKPSSGQTPLPQVELPPQPTLPPFEPIPIETTTETIASLQPSKAYDIFIVIVQKYLSEQPGNISVDIVKYLIAKVVELNNFLNGLFKFEIRVILNKNLTLSYDRVNSSITVSVGDVARYPLDEIVIQPELPGRNPTPRPPESYFIITTLIQNYLTTQAAGNASIEQIILSLKQLLTILERFNRSLRHLLKLEINFVFGDNAKLTPPGDTNIILVVNPPDVSTTDNLDSIGVPPNLNPSVNISPLLLVSIQEFILSQIGNLDATNKFIAGIQSIISKVTYLNLLIEDWIKINISIKMNRNGARNVNTTTEYVVIPIGPTPSIAGKDKFPLLFANIQDIITKVTKLNEVLKGVFTINVNFKSIEFKQPKVTRIIILEYEKGPIGGSTAVVPRPSQHLSVIVFRIIKHYLSISGNFNGRTDPVLILKYVISIVSKLNELLKSWMKIDLQITFPGHGGLAHINKIFVVMPGEVASPELPSISADLPQIHPIITSLLLKYLYTQSPNNNSIEIIIQLIQNVLMRVVEINKSVNDRLHIDLRFVLPDATNRNDNTRICFGNQNPEISPEGSLNQFNILLWINNYLTSINRAQTVVQTGKKIVYLPKGSSLVLPYLYVMSGSKQVYTRLPNEIKNLYGGGFDWSNSLFKELTSKLKMDILGRIKVNVNVDVRKILTPGDLIAALVRGGVHITNVASRPVSSLFGVIPLFKPTRGVRLHVQVNHTGISNPNDLLSLLPAGFNQRSIEDKPIKLSASDGQQLIDKITQLGHHVFKTLEKDPNNESQQLAKSIHGAIHSSPH